MLYPAHKKQNPVLHLFRETGFYATVDHFRPNLSLKESDLMKNTVGTLQPLNASVISPIIVYKNIFQKSIEIGPVRAGYWIPLGLMIDD